ncbi:MAG: hypothetical protein GY748_23165 [Planctomycetaceae bacterium]|nr:hypothetical protein [Planctomycetaceae bacterium]MCP4477926.1 hypothetical protein [Planctomycetaceae bacterium]
MLDGQTRGRFSIRQMMLAMFFPALFSFLTAAAYAGDPAAYGLVLGTAGLVLSIFCMACVSGLAIYLSQLRSVRLKESSEVIIQSGDCAGGMSDRVSQSPEVTSRAYSENGSEGIEKCD